MDFLENIEKAQERGTITDEIYLTLAEFYHSYKDALEKQRHSIQEHTPILLRFLEMVEEQLSAPYSFGLFHEAIREPYDYYQFGLDFLRPLVIFSKSKLIGEEYLQEIIARLDEGENVILLANHQTEPDPQAISLLLERQYPEFAEQMIFVAGHRVTTDPLCIPFSMGRNLLCIYSKKHVEHDQDTKQEKLRHNQRTMQMMGQLLSEGGKVIYVAPSGGRDRLNSEGVVEVAPFDPQSVEMFRLIANASGKTTHFYPLSLATYSLLPPPVSVNKELGEERYTEATPIHMAFGAECDMRIFEDEQNLTKKEKREKRAYSIWQTVEQNYHQLIHK